MFVLWPITVSTKSKTAKISIYLMFGVREEMPKRSSLNWGLTLRKRNILSHESYEKSVSLSAVQFSHFPRNPTLSSVKI